MNYHIILWLLFGVLLITFSILRKRRNKRLNMILWILILLLLIGQTFLPRQLFGKWNSISKFDSKNIIKIVLQPSEPNWEVNLVGNNFYISNKNQVDTIIHLLQNAEVYFPEHPSRIWETKMVLISSQKDSFEIKIHQTENNGTTIYTPTNEWRKDAVGVYIEKLTSYKKPVYSDTSTSRF